ncbi:hypothetical protein ColTof4_05537 [Colletotrichum tofieldiae]|nr:hypothetical protein ColTof3_00697 [Colletotrichum tofieldiae]GKT73114.1 hypothetical protein ColTof4_05537 [Colletotrichum tofieldiae]
MGWMQNGLAYMFIQQEDTDDPHQQDVYVPQSHMRFARRRWVGGWVEAPQAPKIPNMRSDEGPLDAAPLGAPASINSAFPGNCYSPVINHINQDDLATLTEREAPRL